jgi:hypothetical protein
MLTSIPASILNQKSTRAGTLKPIQAQTIRL